MKKTFSLLYLILLITLSCKSQINNSRNIVKINFTNVSYGKLSQSLDSILLLTKATKIDKKYFTSAVFRKNKDKIVCYPIDDRVFNHDFFINFDYNPQRKIKLYLQKFIYKNKEYLIAVRIE